METKIFGKHDAATIQQIETCVAAGGERGVLCADGHKGYAQPIGGVVAYREKISLSGVGFDIACGNLAILTDATRAEVQPAISRIMDEVVRDISFGVGRTSKTRIDHALFDDEAWQLKPLRDLKTTAAEQLGTVGGGNHYVDIFADEGDQVTPFISASSAATSSRLSTTGNRSGRFARRMSSIHGNSCSTSRYRNSSADSAWFCVEGETCSMRREVRQERFDLTRTECARMPLVAGNDETPHPADVRLLGA